MSIDILLVEYLLCIRLKQTFGPYFCCLYSIWSSFLLCSIRSSFS